MRILELVLRGVPGSPGVTKLKLDKGHVIVRAAGARPPLGKLMAYALYDESVEPPEGLREPGAKTSRVGVMLRAQGGAVYRVLRDLRNGAVQLARYDTATQSFEPVSSRASEASQYLRGYARLPAEDLFRDLLWLSADDLPSRWEPPRAQPGRRRPMMAPVMGGAAAAARYEAEAQRAREAQPPAPLRPSSAGLSGNGGGLAAEIAPFDRFASHSIDDRRSMLAELERKKAAVEEADGLQFSLEGKQRALFDLEAENRKVDELAKVVTSASAALEEHALVQEHGDDLEEQVREHDSRRAKHEKALERMEKESEALEERVAHEPKPATRRVLLQTGLLGVLVFTALGLLLDPVRWLLLLNPVPLGLMAASLLEWVGDMQRRENYLWRAAALNERRAREVRRFELETTNARLAMRRLGVSTTEAVLDSLEALKRAKRRHEEAVERLEEAKSASSFATLQPRIDALRGETSSMEGRLRELGGATENIADLMQDIEALKESIARAEQAPAEPSGPLAADSEGQRQPRESAGAEDAPPGSTDAPTEEGERAVSVESEPAVPRMPDPGPMLLSRLGDALLADPNDVAQRVAPRLGKYAAAMTRNRWQRAEFEGRGSLTFAESASGPGTGWEALPRQDLDVLYLAVRLALVEAALEASPLPLLLESPFDGAVDPARRPLIAKMLRHLGSFSQAIHLTDDDFWPSSADAVLSLDET